MSQNRLPRITRVRIPQIIQGLLEGKTHEEIAKECGLKNRRTIERDIQAWRDSGGLETFLTEEWLKMHGKIKEQDPIEAHRQLTKLLGKTLTKKVESKISGGEQPIIVKMWKPDAKDNSN